MTLSLVTGSLSVAGLASLVALIRKKKDSIWRWLMQYSLGHEVYRVDEKGYLHALNRGIPGPTFYVVSAVEKLQREFVLRNSDIIVASYPKCGTTWVQKLVLTLLLGGDASKVPRPMEQAPWIEVQPSLKAFGVTQAPCLTDEAKSVEELTSWDGATKFGPAPPRRVFKTHVPPNIVPWRGGLRDRGGAKIVIVTRNPKDAVVSLYHHTLDIPHVFGYEGDFQHFTSKLFLPGKCESGCFWKWHAEWERAMAEEDSGIHWLSYEELKRDPANTVRKLANFLGIPITEEVLSKTIAGSSFSKMKTETELIDRDLEAKGIHVKPNHMRQGEMGSWRSTLHGPLLEEFDAVHSAKTAEHGLAYTFDFGDP
eukprot:TRINITY_DN10492_c0_g1_i2.p1 TRINITY_DN10492_c0_g1~~TRINITY_DN10492_c0_g1_i2.p1  ORF type:complete len:367 (-),score=56.73 TRINITY_DN10492_c0_g1_i2:110-1210(-)